MQQSSSLEEALLEPPFLVDESIDQKNTEQHLSEEQFSRLGVSFLCSRLGFTWFTPVLDRGARAGRLEIRDLPPLPRNIHPKCCKKIVGPLRTGREASSSQLFWKLASIGGKELIPLICLRLIADTLTILGPLIMGILLKSFNASARRVSSSFMVVEELTADSQYSSFLLSGVFLFTFVIKSFLDSHFSFKKGVLKQKIQSGLISQLFSGVISQPHQNSGKIQNLMSIDTDRASNLCFAWIEIFSMFVQLCGSLILLYFNMAWTCIVGISLVIVMIPVNHWIANLIQKSSSHMMASKDTRASLLSDFFHSVRAIKAYGWETYFKYKVSTIRTEEVRNLKIIKYSDSICVFLWATTSLLMSAGTFGVWSLMGKKLTADRVYPTMSLFNIIILPINAIPWVINGMVESYVSLVRLHEYMSGSNIEKLQNMTPPENYSQDNPIIRFENAQFSHNNGENGAKFQLSIPNLTIQGNQANLVSVQGNVGSGKTSILLALLNELECYSGKSMNTHKAMTYAPQVTFLVPGSIKDNILFGSRFDDERYQKVISACCLDKDFAGLNGGDQFRIQDVSDLSLSGGQKARIMLARALYPKCSSLILIDDMFASLDIKLAKQVAKMAILGDLTRNKTVIIVSNNRDILETATDTITVECGNVEYQRDNRAVSLGDVTTARGPQNTNTTDIEFKSEIDDTIDIEGFRELQLESRVVGGHVSWGTYHYYFSHQRPWLAVTLISLALMQLSRSGADLWLSYNLQPRQNSTEISTSLLKENPFMVAYFGLVALCGFFTIIRSFCFAIGGIASAENIHNDLVDAVFSWNFVNFLSHNSGQIMNRMVTDIALIDDNLPFMLNIYFAQISGLAGIIITLLVSQQEYAGFMLAVFLILIFWFRSIQRKYTACSREIKRLESVFKSPLFSYLHSLNIGCISIRAFRKQEYFIDVLEHHLVNYLTTLYASTCASAWLSLRLQLMSSAVALSVLSIGLYIKEYGSAGQQYSGLIGLSLSYLFPITNLLGGLVSSTSEVEREMVSVERVMKYLDLSGMESNLEVSNTTKMSLHGDIVVHHLDFQYPGSEDLTLRQIDLTIPEFRRCVMCGRSGSGKSTLISCLLGLLPVDAATIFYGNMDINGMSRHILCGNTGYMPQEPVIFSGSIRENLDPYQKFEDEIIINCLDRAGFVETYWKTSSVTPEMLNAPIKSSAFSAAERSLLSLSRLLLRNPRYLYLDEPSSVMNDVELAKILKVVDSVFRECTIVESAHRLSRAHSADLVVILSSGRVIERGKPTELLQKDSEFSKMMHLYGH